MPEGNVASVCVPIGQKTPLSAPEAVSLSRMTLTNFRNYSSLRLFLDEAPVVLTGRNGSGKTNILEAISLLVPGRGLRRSPLSDLQNRASETPWAVSIDLRTETGALTIGTGRDNAVNDSDGERRVVQVDGKPMRKQSLLAEHLALAWIVPEMDRLLVEGSSTRRKFLDRLIYSFDTAHGGRVRAYERALRERLCLLREGRADRRWLDALENELAQKSVAIAAARRTFTERLQRAIDGGGSVFPHAALAVFGLPEDLLADRPALLVEDALREAFVRARADDAQRGTSSVGAHRSDLKVQHAAKNCPAELCSTGEQKALMVAIMLAYVRLVLQHRGMTPLFLLDDCVAHLDDVRRDALFEEVLALGVQAWFTGTDAEAFAAISPYAQMFDVTGGVIR
ncbi:MAG: DNA replication/repair protein RecF [Alphaproteobacteria bacterium]|nr:DNA replication/repair protein RecF [Alphaproteobacteria bacterium]